MRIDEKIEKLMRHMNSLNEFLPDSSPDYLESFDRVYSATNEHLYTMYKNMGVKNKDVLTVGSSGDQILYAILFGAKNITCFDINPFVKYFYDYKVAAIKALDYKRFRAISHFSVSKHENEHWQRELLSATVYKKISSYLPQDSKFFWDNIFMDNNSVHAIFAEYTDYLPDTYFENEEIYIELRRALKKNDYAVSFVNSDITNYIDKFGTEKKYDIILLSNVFFYVCDSRDVFRKIKSFSCIIKKYEKLLKTNGKMQINYLYHKKDKLGKLLVSEFKKILGENNISLIPSRKDDEATLIYSPVNKDLQK